MSTFASDVGYIELPGIREATKVKNYYENAWAKGWTLLGHILCLLFFSVSSLYDMFRDIWLCYR